MSAAPVLGGAPPQEDVFFFGALSFENLCQAALALGEATPQEDFFLFFYLRPLTVENMCRQRGA